VINDETRSTGLDYSSHPTSRARKLWVDTGWKQIIVVNGMLVHLPRGDRQHGE
jgi:hypothetical protein